MQVIRESHCVRVRCWCQKSLCRQRLCLVWCNHFTLLIAISARAGNTLHSCKSWALVRQCLWLSFAAISHALPFDKARRYRHTFFCPADSVLPVKLHMRRDPSSKHFRFGTEKSSACDSMVILQTKNLSEPPSSPPSPVICTLFPPCCSR